MTASKQSGLFGSIMRHVRRLASAFREKPTVTLEDYVLEHFMLYHGLVGSSPEDQRQFKDVRRDIFDAILKKSSVEMGIALKLPPLWWDEKLAAIIGEAHQYREELLSCLLPEQDPFDAVPERLPLQHPDWRVRANAARILSEINAIEAIPQMVAALEQAEDDLQPSFCHIIYALARMQTPQARGAITEQLKNPDPWLKVDALGALSKWPLNEVSRDLSQALLQPNPLSDYSAVAVSKSHKPLALLELAGDQAEAGLEVVIGLIEAARGTFSTDTTFSADLEATLPHVYEMAQKKPSPRRVRALLDLAAFVTEYGEDPSMQQKAESAKTEFSDPVYAQNIMKWFQADQPESDPEFRHAVKLAAHYQIKDAEPHITAHLKLNSPFLNEAIEASGTIGGAESAPHLVSLIDQLVDMEERTSKPLSKQPVFEDRPADAKTYWQTLRALGSLPYKESAECLIKATRDFASDKRQQAYTSLISIGQNETIKATYGPQIIDIVRRGLTDPAAPVRVSALSGVEKMAVLDLVPDAVRLTAAKENSVVRQARRTLAHLAQDGHGALITQSLKTALDGERDSFRRQRLSMLLDDVSQRQS